MLPQEQTYSLNLPIFQNESGLKEELVTRHLQVRV
jgi:hypothetical protein